MPNWEVGRLISDVSLGKTAEIMATSLLKKKIIKKEARKRVQEKEKEEKKKVGAQNRGKGMKSKLEKEE